MLRSPAPFVDAGGLLEIKENLEPDLQPDMPEPEVPTNITCIDRTEHDEETYLVDEAENSLEDQQQIQFGEEEYALLVM